MSSANYQLDADDFVEQCFPSPTIGLRPLRNIKLCGKRCPVTEYERYVDIVSG